MKKRQLFDLTSCYSTYINMTENIIKFIQLLHFLLFQGLLQSGLHVELIAHVPLMRYNLRRTMNFHHFYIIYHDYNAISEIPIIRFTSIHKAMVEVLFKLLEKLT